MPATPVSVTVRQRENKQENSDSDNYDDESYNFKKTYESDDNDDIDYSNGGPNRSARQNTKVSKKNN